MRFPKLLLLVLVLDFCYSTYDFWSHGGWIAYFRYQHANFFFYYRHPFAEVFIACVCIFFYFISKLDTPDPWD